MPRPLSVERVFAQAEALAPAKINLRLRVLGRRPDGYHLLDSIVWPVALFDRVVVTVNPDSEMSISLTTAGRPLPADPRNLAWRAARVFLGRTKARVRVSIALEKYIPIGAGLGGGSSDAAAVLRALQALLDPSIPESDLCSWGLSLGADVPFFVRGRPARMRGVGEILEEPGMTLSAPVAVIAFSETGLATKHVYATYDSLTKSRSASSIPRSSFDQVTLREWLVNDLEAAAFRLQPGLQLLKQRLVHLGAQGVVMTGSGSAVVGLWKSRDLAEAAARSLREGGVWAVAVDALSSTPPLTLDFQ